MEFTSDINESTLSLADFAFEKYFAALSGSNSDNLAAITFNHTFAICGDNQAWGSCSP